MYGNARWRKNTVGVRTFQTPSPSRSLVYGTARRRLRFLHCVPFCTRNSAINISERARYCARKRNYTILARGDKKKREKERTLRRWWKESEKPVGSRICAIYLTITSACLYFLREKDKWTERKYIITIGYEYYEINNFIKHCTIIDVHNVRKNIEL